MHQLFFQLLLVLLPTQLGYHFWPEWAMVLGRRVDYLAPTVYLTDILIGLVLFFWLMEWAKSMKGLVFSIKGGLIRFPKSFILLAVFVAFNIFVASNRPVALYKWMKVFEFALLGWYIVRSKPSLSLVATFLSIGVLYSSILAITQFALQRSVGGPLWWLGERTFTADTPGIARFESCQLSAVSCQLFLRAYATFPHPNVLGGFLVTVLPLLIYNLQIYKSTNLQMNESMKKMMHWGLIVTIVLGVIALLLTFSRSAWVAGTVGIGMSIWYLVSRKKLQSYFSFILYTIPFILFVVSLVLTVSPQEESVVVRQQLNAAAISMWQGSPAFGVGLGNFLVELPKNLVSRQIYFLQPVHNIYLLLLSEVGVVGIGLIVLSLWALLRQETRNKRQEIRKFEHVACLVSLVSLLILGLVDHYLLTLQQGQLLLTVLIGMSITFLQRNKATN